MNPLLQDLYGHLAWTDAEHWRAIEMHPVARDDQAIRDRLHHIHLVQRLFIWAIGDLATQFAFTKPEDFRTLDSLKAFARESHSIVDQFLSSVTDMIVAVCLGHFRSSI